MPKKLKDRDWLE